MKFLLMVIYSPFALHFRFRTSKGYLNQKYFSLHRRKNYEFVKEIKKKYFKIKREKKSSILCSKKKKKKEIK